MNILVKIFDKLPGYFAYMATGESGLECRQWLEKSMKDAYETDPDNKILSKGIAMVYFSLASWHPLAERIYLAELGMSHISERIKGEISQDYLLLESRLNAWKREYEATEGFQVGEKTTLADLREKHDPLSSAEIFFLFGDERALKCLTHPSYEQDENIRTFGDRLERTRTVFENAKRVIADGKGCLPSSLVSHINSYLNGEGGWKTREGKTMNIGFGSAEVKEWMNQNPNQNPFNVAQDEVGQMTSEFQKSVKEMGLKDFIKALGDKVVLERVQGISPDCYCLTNPLREVIKDFVLQSAEKVDGNKPVLKFSIKTESCQDIRWCVIRMTNKSCIDSDFESKYPRLQNSLKGGLGVSASHLCGLADFSVETRSGEREAVKRFNILSSNKDAEEIEVLKDAEYEGYTQIIRIPILGVSSIMAKLSDSSQKSNNV